MAKIDKRYKSRKLIAFIVVNIILTTFVFVALFQAPEVLQSTVLVMYMTMTVLNAVTYIGGKALETWAKSKYFHKELL